MFCLFTTKALRASKARVPFDALRVLLEPARIVAAQHGLQHPGKWQRFWLASIRKFEYCMLLMIRWRVSALCMPLLTVQDCSVSLLYKYNRTLHAVFADHRIQQDDIMLCYVVVLLSSSSSYYYYYHIIMLCYHIKMISCRNPSLPECLPQSTSTLYSHTHTI
jgi:hypothetical protein